LKNPDADSNPDPTYSEAIVNKRHFYYLTIFVIRSFTKPNKIWVTIGLKKCVLVRKTLYHQSDNIIVMKDRNVPELEQIITNPESPRLKDPKH
jgi:hypothetical protein